jgi:hypothetical protein
MDFKKIRDNLSAYYETFIVPGGYSYCEPQTIKQIDAYYNSHFLTGDLDYQGQRKPFYNIVKTPCDIGSKLIDFDRKDIIIVPTVHSRLVDFNVAVKQKKVKDEMKLTNFGQLINDLGDDYPKYGHIYSLKTKDGWKKINIQNVRCHPGYENIDESPFVAILSGMSKADIDEMSWNGEDIDKLTEDKDYIVYQYLERQGKKWKRYFLTELYNRKSGSGMIETPENQYMKGSDEYLPGLVLHEDEIKEFPLKEQKWDKVPGRHLGCGFVEVLFPEQQEVNMVAYLRGKTLFLKALQLFFSKDESIGNSVISDLEFGQIINTQFDIQALPVNNADISAYNDTFNTYLANAQKKTNSTDIASGDSLPSGTPLGSARLQASFTVSYFNKKRENFALFFKPIIYDLMKSAKVKKGDEMLLSRSDSEYDFVLEFVSENNVNKKYAGRSVDKAEYQAEIDKEKQRLSKAKNLAIEVDSDIEQNMEAYVDIVITGEAVDINSKQQIYQFILSSVSSNPGLLVSPTTRAMMFSMLRMAGESPIALEAISRQVDTGQQLPQAGGGQKLNATMPQVMAGNNVAEV